MKVKVNLKKAKKDSFKLKISKGNQNTLEEFFDNTNEINWKEISQMRSGWRVREFFDTIGYSDIVENCIAFEEALSLEEITYKAVIEKVYEQFKGKKLDDGDSVERFYTKKDINNILTTFFNNWLEDRPDVKKYCPNISVINLIQYFVKKVKEDKEKAIRNLENKINKIPEGKIFSLAEYLDYSQEYKCDTENTSYMEKAGDFMEKIEYPITPCSIMAFGEAIFLSENLSYEEMGKLIDVPGNTTAQNINILKKEFNIWLEKRLDVKKYCPNADVIQLLEYFKKKAIENEKN